MWTVCQKTLFWKSYCILHIIADMTVKPFLCKTCATYPGSKKINQEISFVIQARWLILVETSSCHLFPVWYLVLQYIHSTSASTTTDLRWHLKHDESSLPLPWLDLTPKVVCTQARNMWFYLLSLSCADMICATPANLAKPNPAKR